MTRASAHEPKTLTWSLVVATLDREECLLRSLWANVQQERPPEQVVVVDASEGWEKTRDRVFAEIAPHFPSISWTYVDSKHRSSTRQRNIGLIHCSGDVVFFLDDDSFMYRDCAREIMRLYDGDRDQGIGGVCAVLTPRPERDAPTGESAAKGSAWPGGPLPRFKRRLHSLWDQERLFIPYDGRYHRQEVVSADVGLPIALFHGCRMTFRTAFVRELGGFEEMLVRTAFGEDADLSYRMSQKHPLVVATKARLFHEQTPVGRTKRSLNTTLVLLNSIALYRLNTPQQSEAGRVAYSFLLRRIVLELIRDCARPRRGMPHVRGALRALRYASQVLAIAPEQLPESYARLQQQIFEQG